MILELLLIAVVVIPIHFLIRRLERRSRERAMKKEWRRQLDELEAAKQAEQDIINSRKACGCFGACAESILNEEIYYCDFKGDNE